MQSFFWHVLADERVHKTLIKEVDEAVRTGALPPSGHVSWAQGQSLGYFQACLKEAMRVRPAVGVNITRLVPPEGAELDGQFFPGGTRIAVNGWVLHRDRPMFGQDADDFRPERWTEDEERARRMERYMFQVSAIYVPPAPHPPSTVLLLTGLGAVWRGCARLHREKSCPSRDQQGTASAAERL